MKQLSGWYLEKGWPVWDVAGTDWSLKETEPYVILHRSIQCTVKYPWGGVLHGLINNSLTNKLFF